MILTFLGTGTSQGVPMIACPCDVCHSADSQDKRLRTSALLEVEGKTLMIDAGPDFRTQLLRENVLAVHAILLTHEHRDHMGGLDDVRSFNYFMRAPMPVFGESRVLAALQREYAYAFSANKYPGSPEIELHEINETPFRVANILVQPIRAMHYKLPVYGFRIGSLVYITDANYLSQESKEQIQGCSVLVVNALRKEEHLSHFTLQEALSLIDEIKPDRAYLTHLSHQMGLHKDIQSELPANVFVAYDGLKVYI